MANPRGNWKKGQSGNPAGRKKKGETMTDILNERLETNDPNISDRTKKEIVVDKLYELAKEGNLGAIKYLVDRIDGKPIETISHHGLQPSVIEIPDGIMPSVNERALAAIHRRQEEDEETDDNE